ncbi:hypothetical protein [Nocardioides acrostichi]|nr:hypothetical protein [Nocardioides acrostichi]
MSATQLGSFFGRGGAAMNVLLHEHGFIEGGPGAWRPTELGQQFAKWVDKDNGYGGYAHRAWSWLTWNDDVVDALKASIKANPDGILPAAPPEVVTSAVAGVKAAANNPGSGKGKWIVLGLLGAAAVATPVIRYVRGKDSVEPEASAHPATRDPEDPGATEPTGAPEGDLE